MKLPRYILIGGFLGAGKTTAMLKFALYLKNIGLRVGLITNDQSVNLVDTARAKAQGMSVSEITGGCFCCRFNNLVEASNALANQIAPDVFLAEPVGSCTDIQATVNIPLRKLYGDKFQVSPLSVMIDPIRCGRVLGLWSGKNFTEKVVYIYKKQLEEAEIIVVNKIDLLNSVQRAKLVQSLFREFPKARVMEISATTGEGLENWFKAAMNETPDAHGMAVDYDAYADGEAMLGWVNTQVKIESEKPFDGNQWIASLATRIRDDLKTRGIEIAHLKLLMSHDDGPDVASVSLTGIDSPIIATHELQSPLNEGVLMLNLRAEGEPSVLEECLMRPLKGSDGMRVHLETTAAFRPGRPNPTHRMNV